jgi:hypothetical protein
MTQSPGTAGGKPPSSKRTLWLYGYDVGLPDGEPPLRAIRGVIMRENLSARRSGWNWAARLVPRPRAAQLLIVSDSADDVSENHRHLESALTALGVGLLPMHPLSIRRL